MSDHIETICVQGGYRPGNGEPRQVPIIQSTTFKYESSADMAKLFDLEAEGYFYSRLQNPTCDHAAKKIAELEGGTAAMLTALVLGRKAASSSSSVQSGATKVNSTPIRFIVTAKRL